MKTLLVHAADAATVSAAKAWRDQQDQPEKIVRLSLYQASSSDADSEGYVARQIQKAQSLYGTQKVVHFSN